MDTNAIIIAIFAAFFTVGLSLMIITMITASKAIKKNTYMPKIRTSARVLSKRMDEFAVSRKKEIPRYYATFEFDTKDKAEYQISEDCYQFIQPGDSGTITIKGTQFIGFNLDV